ncbi:MAG: GDP-mannose 4,6-dehydratase, partial [Thermodesulfobacteriota bacterium]
DGRVVSNFVVQALKNEDITIYGDGNQTRSFCYVDDLINGIMLMMNTKDGFTGPVNLGNPNDERTILELAELIIRLTASKSKIINKTLPENDPVRRKPDITIAKRELAWEPKVDIEDGLKETIKYFKTII